VPPRTLPRTIRSSHLALYPTPELTDFEAFQELGQIGLRQYVITEWPRHLWCADIDSRLKCELKSTLSWLFDFIWILRNAEKPLWCNLQNILRVKFRKIHLSKIPHSAKYTFPISSMLTLITNTDMAYDMIQKKLWNFCSQEHSWQLFSLGGRRKGEPGTYTVVPHTCVVCTVDDSAYRQTKRNSELSARRTTTTCNAATVQLLYLNAQCQQYAHRQSQACQKKAGAQFVYFYQLWNDNITSKYKYVETTCNDLQIT